LFEVGNLPIGICKVRASDKIRAIEVLAKLHGWYAPEKTDLREDLKIERIECVIVEPQNRDGGSVPPAAGAYDQLASHNR
jgi:hypothetical protein